MSKGGGTGGSPMSAIAAALAGGPVAQAMRLQMEIEQRVRELTKLSPMAGQIYAPAIEQARSAVAATLGNLAQGGMPASPQDAGAAPPGAIPPGPAAGVPGMPMPPPG